jgi:hypothetical protein
MRFIRTVRKKLEFEFGPEEKELLVHVLNLYPLVPESHLRLSKGGQIPNPEENQHLLEEALKAQRQSNQRAVAVWLSDTGRFAAGDSGFRVLLARGEIDWLLQVLNDVRIGSWIALGSPGYGAEKKRSQDRQAARHRMLMELAGGFQSYFLGALNGELPPEQK